MRKFIPLFCTFFCGALILGCSVGVPERDTGRTDIPLWTQDGSPDVGQDIGQDKGQDVLAPDTAIPAGNPGGPCLPGNKCNSGLKCVSGICVYAPDIGVDTTSDIFVPTCGNAIKEPGEACDDGNTNDDDQCNANCTLACTGGVTFNLHCYVYQAAYGDTLTWVQAAQVCEDKSMHLLTVDSQAESVFVRNSLGIPTSTRIWIGLNDMAKEGTWVWATGEKTTYKAWRPGEPNDAIAGEDCAALWSEAFDWIDYPCL
ncbi:MAG: lectin-like protein, partial [Pseudomonadota bacterium]